MFPWAGFLLGGAIAGELIQAARTDDAERRLQLGFFIAGSAGIAIAYALSFQPSIYRERQFLDQLTDVLLHAARAEHGAAADRLGDRSLPCLCAATVGQFFSAPDVPGRVITTLGRSSLFVYWIHVEMAYGAIALPLRRSMPLELSLLGTVALCALLYQIVRWKDRKMREVQLTGPSES